MTCAHEPIQADVPLSPLRVRLLVYVVLVLVALASIWVIDRRAMTMMHRGQETRQR